MTKVTQAIPKASKTITKASKAITKAAKAIPKATKAIPKEDIFRLSSAQVHDSQEYTTQECMTVKRT